MDSTELAELVQKNLQVVGVEPEATQVYVALLSAGPSSALSLSKVTKISRTQIYRHLEQLQTHGLASAEQLTYGTLFRALPLENIEGSIAAKEAETATVKLDLQFMADGLRALTGASGPKSTTMHYYGMGGLKQVNWNLTKAEKEYRVFETAHLTQHFDKDGKAFAKRCRERCIERELVSFDLTNMKKIDAKDVVPVNLELAQYRHIDPEILKINFEIYLYNSVVTLIDYSPDEPQATEIHHPALKAMMTQLFDSMWNIAEPIEVNQ